MYICFKFVFHSVLNIHLVFMPIKLRKLFFISWMRIYFCFLLCIYSHRFNIIFIQFQWKTRSFIWKFFFFKSYEMNIITCLLIDGSNGEKKLFYQFTAFFFSQFHTALNRIYRFFFYNRMCLYVIHVPRCSTSQTFNCFSHKSEF